MRPAAFWVARTLHDKMQALNAPGWPGASVTARRNKTKLQAAVNVMRVRQCFCVYWGGPLIAARDDPYDLTCPAGNLPGWRHTPACDAMPKYRRMAAA